MYAGNTYAGITFAGELFNRLRRGRAGRGVGGSGFPAIYDLLNTEEDKRKRRSRETILAMREDEDVMGGLT